MTFLSELVVYLYLRLDTPSIVSCCNPAKPQAVPFITLTAGVSDLCVSLTRKSCQHAASSFSEKRKKSQTPSPFVFDHCAPVCSVPFSVMASRTGGSLKRQTKVAGSMFTLSDEKEGAAGKRLHCQACSLPPVHSLTPPPPPPRVFLPPSSFCLYPHKDRDI